MKQVNLLPKIEQRQIRLDVVTHQLLRFWVIVPASVVILIILVFASQIYLRTQIASTSDQIAAEAQSLKTADTQNLESQVLDLNQQIRLVETVKKQHYEWSKALVELDRLLPNDLVITVVSLDRATGKIDLTGTAQNRDSILKFWSNVKKSTMFKDINFPLANLEKPVDASFTFTLVINEEAIKIQ